MLAQGDDREPGETGDIHSQLQEGIKKWNHPLTGLYREKGSAGGKRYSRLGRFTDTWIKSGKWLAVRRGSVNPRREMNHERIECDRSRAKHAKPLCTLNEFFLLDRGRVNDLLRYDRIATYRI